MKITFEVVNDDFNIRNGVDSEILLWFEGNFAIRLNNKDQIDEMIQILHRIKKEIDENY